MVVTSAVSCSFTFTRQTYTTRSTSFADMLSGAANGASQSASSLFSSMTEDSDVLEQLYQHLTGQVLGAKSSVQNMRAGTFDQTFIPPAMLASAGKVDATRPFNAESQGDKQLTDAQIAELKSKYNFDNMSYQDQYDFFCDLTDMGVLSAADVESIGLSAISNTSALTVSSETYTFTRIVVKDTSNDLLEYLMATLCRERKDYEYMQNLCADEESDNYENNLPAIERFKENQPSIENIISRHEKVYDVLSRIM